MDPLVLNVNNLRFRDNRTVFDTSARWLDTHRDDAVPAMVEAVRAAGPSAIGAARVLGQFGDPRAVPALAEALGARDDQLAFEAARALSRIEDEAAQQALVDALGSDDDGTVKNALRGAEMHKGTALCEPSRAHLDGRHAMYAKRAVAACCEP